MTQQLEQSVKLPSSKAQQQPEQTAKQVLQAVSKKLESPQVPNDSFAQKKPRSVVVHASGRVSVGATGRRSGRKGKGGKKGKGKGKRGKRGFSGPRPQTLGTFRTVVPDRITLELPFLYQGHLANAGLAYASVRFVSNGLYDPDPTVGGNSFLGLAEWTSLYAYYRPLQLFYEVTVINQEAFPMSVYLYNLNRDPGGVVGTAGGIYSEQQFGKRTMVGPLTAGDSKHTFRGRVSFSELLGDKGDLMNDDNYRGLLNSSNPADGFYLGFNSEANVVQTAAGMLYTITMKVVVQLYDRIPLT
jgi:hypothetical protein